MPIVFDPSPSEPTRKGFPFRSPYTYAVGAILQKKNRFFRVARRDYIYPHIYWKEISREEARNVYRSVKGREPNW